MTVIFPVLLGGLVLAGIPILVHFIMRQKPKILRFPAFRFLVQRHRTNLRKLRLRHLLLLALRIFLLAALCLALARPRVEQQGLTFGNERPVAAVLLFDTSPSMDYKTSDGVSRLDEAKKRGLEFLDQLPEGSRLLVLDTAEGPLSDRGDWLRSFAEARERIKALKVRATAGPLTPRLEFAYRQLADLGRSGEDDPARLLPRFICVFSDRTRAAWDAGRQTQVLERSDEVPSLWEGLQQARDQLPGLMELLPELRAKLPPPAGQDYPEQALLEFAGQLRERLSSLSKEDLPGDEKLLGLTQNVQRRARDLRAMLQAQMTVDKEAAPNDYRTKLLQSLHEVLRDLRGAQGLFVDVGAATPIDLAITQVEFPKLPDGQPQQLFGADEKFLLNVLLKATGKDVSTTVQCQLGKKTYQQAAELKAGDAKTVSFEIDLQELQLAPGPHQLEVRLATSDLLAFNNQRYATFAIQEARKILVVAPAEDKIRYFLDKLQSLKHARIEIAPAFKTPADAVKLDDLGAFKAIYLVGVPAPPQELWNKLEDYVHRGGGLALVPGGEEMDRLNYNHKTLGQKLSPGIIEEKQTKGKDGQSAGAIWDLTTESVFQHPLLKPVRGWRDFDFVKDPGQAFVYWDVKPDKEATVLVRYDDKGRPALLERRVGQGKALLLTTPLDDRKPRWNNYMETIRSTYVGILYLTTKYLVGDSESVNLNFTIGKDNPLIHLSAAPRYQGYSLRGPDLLEQITAPDKFAPLVIRQALTPGNYQLDGLANDPKNNVRVAAFSVNSPAEESDLSQVPAAEIESVLGTGSLIALDRKADIRDALKGHMGEPVELFPLLMVLILLLLAVENLLANKFYRMDNEAKETASPQPAPKQSAQEPTPTELTQAGGP